jgi:hypothetical protein
MYIWWAKVAATMALDQAKRLINPLNSLEHTNLVKPVWYDH